MKESTISLLWGNANLFVGTGVMFVAVKNLFEGDIIFASIGVFVSAWNFKSFFSMYKMYLEDKKREGKLRQGAE